MLHLNASLSYACVLNYSPSKFYFHAFIIWTEKVLLTVSCTSPAASWHGRPPSATYASRRRVNAHGGSSSKAGHIPSPGLLVQGYPDPRVHLIPKWLFHRENMLSNGPVAHLVQLLQGYSVAAPAPWPASDATAMSVTHDQLDTVNKSQSQPSLAGDCTAPCKPGPRGEQPVLVISTRGAQMQEREKGAALARLWKPGACSLKYVTGSWAGCLVPSWDGHISIQACL